MHVIWSRKALPPLPLPCDINILPTIYPWNVEKLPTVNFDILHVPVSRLHEFQKRQENYGYGSKRFAKLDSEDRNYRKIPLAIC